MNSLQENPLQEIIKQIREQKISSQSKLNYLKRNIAKKYNLKTIPTNIEILLSLPKEEINDYKKILITKPTRTISGVAPVAIMTKPFPCPHAQSGGPCIMCPGGPKSEFGNVPQSYTGKEPATMRGIRNKYDPYLQIFNRLEQYTLLGHNCEKVELILMGGTFPSFPLDYQEEFVKYAFKAMNDFSSLFYVNEEINKELKEEFNEELKEDFNKELKEKLNEEIKVKFNHVEFNYIKFKEFFDLPSADFGNKQRIKKIHERILKVKNKTKTTLKKEQQKNETAKIRCVALCIETRPDYGMLKHANQMLKLGATRVELGIQSVYDDVLRKIKRGHTTDDTKKSIRILKDMGFKVAAHYMPGLPGVDRKKDLKGMKLLFEDTDYRPDMLKIYPCMVVKGTQLYEEYKQGKFKPLNADEATKLIVEFKRTIPEYCRVQRVQRDIPTSQIEAGVEMTNLRQYMHHKFNVQCRCIRCREPREKEINWSKIKIKIGKYDASQGKEFFISAEDTESDLLAGFCRLRFPSQQLRKEITKNSALVRELHVYGTAAGIGEKGEVQHKGIGRKLMGAAEEISRRNGKDKVVVTSGIGVKEYYRKLGYKKEGAYMVKKI